MSESAPKFNAQEMVCTGYWRYEWAVPRALRVVVWRRWWQNNWSCRAYLGPNFEICTPILRNQFSAQEAAGAAWLLVRGTAQGLARAFQKVEAL